jgi:hypothetical protein
MRRLKYLNGLYRLLFGVCPLCNSSPPRHRCIICGGSYAYGPRLSPEVRAQWRANWAWWCA